MAAISVGSVSVDVVPSVENFTKTLRAKLIPEAANLGAEIGKSISAGITKGLGDPISDPIDRSVKKQQTKAPKQGQDVAGAFARGFQNRLKAAFASLPKAEISADSSDADRTIESLRAQLKTLSGKTINVDIDEKTALAEIELIKRELESLSNNRSVQVRVDVGTALAKLTAIQAEIDRIDGKNAKVKVEVDTKSVGEFAKNFQDRLKAAFAALPKANINVDSSAADRAIESVRARLETLSKKTIGIDIDEGQALAELELIKVELERIGRTASVQVKADTAAAAAQLAAIEAEVDRLDGRDAQFRVTADTRDAGKSMLFLSLSVAAVAAIPVGAVLGAGVLSLIGPLAAAGAGFGGLAAVAVPALTRIKTAVDAQKAAAIQNVATGARAQGQALAEAGAQAQLASAIRNAGFAHQQAVDQVRSAEQQLTTAEQSAVTAQRELTQARADAQRALQDMKNQLIDAGLAVQQSQFDIDSARASLDRMRTSATAAANAVAQAQATLAQAQTAQQTVAVDPNATPQALAQAAANTANAQAALKSAQDQKKAQDLQVRQAQLAYNQTIQRLKEQQLQLRRLQQDERTASKAGVDGSNAVVSARQRLSAANQQVSNSELALSRARQNVARTDQNSADQVANAQRAMTQASLQTASANARLRAAMAALSPQERGLLRDWKGLTTEFRNWAKALEPDVLPIFTRGINLVKSALPSLTPVVKGAAGAVNGLLDDVAKSAKSPFWTQFRTNLTNLVPTAITGLGKSTGNVITGVSGIVNAFLPYAPQILSWLTKITGEFANWGTGLGTSNGFSNFIDYVKQAGPEVWKTLKDVGKALVDVATALSGMGLGTLVGIRGLAGIISEMSPGEIQAIATAFLAVRGAIVLNVAATKTARAIQGINDAISSGGKKGPILARGLVLVSSKLKSLSGTAATASKSLVTGLIGGFKNVDSAMSDNASLSTRIGAGIRSQLTAWRQQAVAVASSTRALAAQAAAATRAKVASAGSWLKTQASALKTAAAAQWDNVRATTAQAVAVGKAKAAQAGGWIATQAKALGAVAAAQWANVRATTASIIATVRQRIATIASTIAQYAVRAATAAWAAIQAVLNAVMSANPIGLIIVAIVALVAAVIYAYTHWGWFRTAVQATWNAIKVAALFVWNYVLKPIFDAMKFYIMNILIPYYKFLWDMVVLAFHGIATVGLWLWHNVMRPVWNGIKFIVGLAWAGIKLYFKLIELGFKALGTVGRWLWHNVMAPIWHGIQSTISVVWNTGIKPIFNVIKTGIYKVGDAFGVAARAIGKAWDKVKEYTKAPIHFVIETVYNKGIVGMWNKVMGWLHLEKQLRLSEYHVPGLETGGELSAAQPISPMMTNGPMAIVGEGNPRYPEYVIPTDPKYRGNAAALWASAGSDMQMLAGGGVLGGILKTVKGVAGKILDVGKDALGLIANPKKIWDSLASPVLNQAKSLGTSDYGKAAAAIPPKMLGEAWTSAKQIIESFKSVFGAGGGAMVELAKTQIGVRETGVNVQRYSHEVGRPSEEWCADFIDWLAMKTGNKSAVPWTASAPGMANAFGGRYHSGTSGATAGDVVFFGPSKAGIYHVGLASGPASGGSIPTIAGNSSNMVRAYTGTGIAGYAHPNYPNPGTTKSAPGSLVHASPGTAQSWARQNLKDYGWSLGQFSPLVNLWNRESGWRWNALNRSSGAYGIPQSLPASKMRSAGSDWRDNAGTQVKWGLGYIRDRYGSPSGAWAHSQHTGWYDNGGWLPTGPSLVYNGTGRPEPVFTGNQFDQMVEGRSGGGVEYHAHFDGMTQAAYQTQVRSAFHSMSVADANRERVDRRR